MESLASRRLIGAAGTSDGNLRNGMSSTSGVSPHSDHRRKVLSPDPFEFFEPLLNGIQSGIRVDLAKSVSHQVDEAGLHVGLGPGGCVGFGSPPEPVATDDEGVVEHVRPVLSGPLHHRCPLTARRVTFATLEGRISALAGPTRASRAFPDGPPHQSVIWLVRKTNRPGGAMTLVAQA